MHNIVYKPYSNVLAMFGFTQALLKMSEIISLIKDAKKLV